MARRRIGTDGRVAPVQVHSGHAGPHAWEPERVVALRSSLELSQSQLAGRIGVSTATVQQWERGTTHPNTKAAAALAVLEDVAV